MSDLFRQGFFVREPAWHGMGEVLSEYPGRDEAMRIAGHDHQVEERVIALTSCEFDRATAPELTTDCRATARAITSYKAIVRADNHDLIGVMNASYEVIQNDKPWDLVDAIANVDNVRYETGGILGGRFGSDDDTQSWQLKRGNVYWVLAHLDEPHVITGDTSPVYPFILATWSHDGSQALRVKETDVRVVCANTQHLALRGAGQEFTASFRHVGNADERIREAVLSVDQVRTAHEAFVERANELAVMGVSDAGLERFVEYVVPMPEVAREQLISDRVVHNIETAREAIRSLLNGPTCEGIRNTAWGLVQAGIEHHDHLRKATSADTYFRRQLISMDKVKRSFEETAVRVAEECPA